MATRLKLHDSGGIHGSGGGREVGKGEKYLEHVKEQSALSPEESLLKLQEQVQEEMASALCTFAFCIVWIVVWRTAGCGAASQPN